MLLKLYAKVMIQDEDQMEAQATYDLGTIAKSKEWVWKNIGILVENVNQVTAYSTSKSIVDTVSEDGEKAQILVAEPFEDVFNKWRIALLEYHNVIENQKDGEE